MDSLKLLKNNDNRTDTDLEWVVEFYEFLQGNIPSSINLSKGHNPKMSHKKAMSIIWYLQEHFPIIPDTIEQCSNCNSLYDTNKEGLYWETKGKHFCGGCSDIVPYNYDKGKR
jgi:hypothetical protein